MSCRRRYSFCRRHDPICVLVNQISAWRPSKAHQLDVFGYFISELCYSSDRTAESYRQLHPGHAYFCQIASVDPGRAQHRFECLDLCESEATLYLCDISSERDWSERYICPSRHERCFHQTAQVPSCQVAKKATRTRLVTSV